MIPDLFHKHQTASFLHCCSISLIFLSSTAKLTSHQDISWRWAESLRQRKEKIQPSPASKINSRVWHRLIGIKSRGVFLPSSLCAQIHVGRNPSSNTFLSVDRNAKQLQDFFLWCVIFATRLQVFSDISISVIWTNLGISFSTCPTDLCLFCKDLRKCAQSSPKFHPKPTVLCAVPPNWCQGGGFMKLFRVESTRLLQAFTVAEVSAISL